jgi:hypothetical protein
MNNVIKALFIVDAIMNWFQTHLHLTVLLLGLSIYIIGFVTGGIIMIASKQSSEFAAIPIIVNIILNSILMGWFLRQKNRGYAWLIFIIVPFGFLVYFLLQPRVRVRLPFFPPEPMTIAIQDSKRG